MMSRCVRKDTNTIFGHRSKNGEPQPLKEGNSCWSPAGCGIALSAKTTIMQHRINRTENRVSGTMAAGMIVDMETPPCNLRRLLDITTALTLIMRRHLLYITTAPLLSKRPPRNVVAKRLRRNGVGRDPSNPSSGSGSSHNISDALVRSAVVILTMMTMTMRMLMMRRTTLNMTMAMCGTMKTLRNQNGLGTGTMSKGHMVQGLQ